MLKELIRKHLDTKIAPWLKSKGIEKPFFYALEVPPKNINGDLSINIAMLLSRELKTKPFDIAKEAVAVVKSALEGFIDDAFVAGPGFVNFTLSSKFLQDEISSILDLDKEYGRLSNSPDEKVLVEFVSANPTGPLHIGHGRGAAIGDSLSRVLVFLGRKVEKEYYLNDVGNQMLMLGSSVEERYKELKGEPHNFPEDGYKGDYIRDIAKKYLDSKMEGKITFKEFAVSEIMNSIKSDLQQFDVKFDNWFSEGLLADTRTGPDRLTEVERVTNWLKDKGFAYERDGALWFEAAKLGDEKDRVLKRSDGRFTYLSSDIAYHKNKLERNFTKMVNLMGADHHGYVARMKAAIAALGENPDKLVLILYQLVSLVRNGQPVAMSTRSGEFVTLKEVLDEVGKDACRFSFLLRAPDSHLEFDLELAKKQSSENPVFYVQYVHARCNSLFREALKTGSIPSGGLAVDISLLSTEEERILIKKLIMFGDALALCERAMSPHHLAIYLMELADLFHKFYEKCRVVSQDSKLTDSRLALVKSVSIVIRNGLALLGVSAPEKM